MATLNNGLKTIEFNSINWRTIFNDNMQKLDISTINFVLESELPTNNFIAERLFFTTDTVKFFYDDGTQILSVGASEQIIIGLDTDKLTSTSDQEFFYATDTNILYFNSTGTMISLTGSVDLTDVETDIISTPGSYLNFGSDTQPWHLNYMRNVFATAIYPMTSSSNLMIDASGQKCTIKSWSSTIAEFYDRITLKPGYGMYIETSYPVEFSSANATKIQFSKVDKVVVTNDLTDISTFTKLGDLSPSIKVKKIIGTTGATQGETVSELHNLTGSKIISFTLKIEQNANEGVSSEHTFNSGFQVSIHHTDTSFVVSNSAINSGSILSKPYTIYVTYEA